MPYVTVHLDCDRALVIVTADVSVAPASVVTDVYGSREIVVIVFVLESEIRRSQDAEVFSGYGAVPRDVREQFGDHCQGVQKPRLH